MSYAVAVISILFFAITFRAVGVAHVAVTAIGRTRHTIAFLADGNQTEDSKERAARETAISLFGSLAAITALSLVALVPGAVALVVGVMAGITDEASLTAALLSPWLAIAACAAFAFACLFRR